ncbi:mechanosensitive ion channel [Rubrivirga sp. IMCC45206]|uniref:mechanosensitive ion channel n=1 Tax=Rubrivirga sp. IMCC45206 TaxID=3391614 RepID=UPI00398F9F0C
MQDFFTNVEATMGPLWPVLVFVLILLVGYVVAKVVEGVVRGALKRTTIDDRFLASLSDSPQISSEKIGGRIAFWIVMVLALIAAFNAVDLGDVGGPLGGFVSTIIAFIPNLIGALLLAIVAYAVARVLSMLTTKALHAANIDERIATAGDATPAPAGHGSSPAGEVSPGAEADLAAAHDRAEARMAGGAAARSGGAAGRSGGTSLAETLGTAVFYFVILLFLPAILGALELSGILAPVQGLVNEILAFLPNLLLAAIILVVGAFVARVIRKIVANLAAAAGANQLSERVGLAKATGGTQLSDLLGLVVYILVLIPVIVSALQALDVEAVTAPASAMLAQFLEAIPRIFVAALILGIAYVVGRLLASLVSSLLAGVGFNRLFEGLGFRSARSEVVQPTDAGDAVRAESLDTKTPAGLAGWVVLVAVMLFAATEAAAALGLASLAVLVAEFTVLAGQVLLGLLIFAVGLYLSNLAYQAVKSNASEQSDMLAVAARVSILVFAGAMALKQMGLADSIVNLAFGLILGAIALAAAIAFGWGGRDVAREQLEKLRDAKDAPRVLKPKSNEPGASPQTRPDLTDTTPGS